MTHSRPVDVAAQVPPRANASRPRRSRAKLAIKLAVTAAVIALLAWKIPWERFWGAVSSLEPKIWFTVLCAFIAGHAVGVFKWRFNVNLGHANLKVLDAVQCYAAGMFANLFLPSIVGGDAVKAVLAGRTTGRFEAAVIGGATERLIDTIALLLLIVAGAAACQGQVPAWAQPAITVGLAIVGLGSVLFLPLVMRMRIQRWPRKLRRVVGRSLVALRRLWRRPHYALFVLALSLAIQSWFVVLNYWLGRGIGIDVPLAVWFFAVPAVKALTLAPISFGGLVVREGALAWLLFTIAGVDEPTGAAASILWQTVVYSTGLICAVIWFALGFRAGARTGGGRDSLRSAGVARG